MIAPSFSPEAAESLRPHIQKTVDSLLDEMIKAGCEKPVNLVDAFSLPLPSYVSFSCFAIITHSMLTSHNISLPLQIIYGILGVPQKDLAYLTTQAAIRTNGSATALESSKANQSLLDYLGNLVEVKKKEPGDDLISTLIREQMAPGRIGKEDVVQLAFLMLVAGNATMVTMINVVSFVVPSYSFDPF